MESNPSVKSVSFSTKWIADQLQINVRQAQNISKDLQNAGYIKRFCVNNRWYWSSKMTDVEDMESNSANTKLDTNHDVSDTAKSSSRGGAIKLHPPQPNCAGGVQFNCTHKYNTTSLNNTNIKNTNKQKDIDICELSVCDFFNVKRQDELAGIHQALYPNHEDYSRDELVKAFLSHLETSTVEGSNLKKYNGLKRLLRSGKWEDRSTYQLSKKKAENEAQAVESDLKTRYSNYIQAGKHLTETLGMQIEPLLSFEDWKIEQPKQPKSFPKSKTG